MTTTTKQYASPATAKAGDTVIVKTSKSRYDKINGPRIEHLHYRSCAIKKAGPKLIFVGVDQFDRCGRDIGRSGSQYHSQIVEPTAEVIAAMEAEREAEQQKARDRASAFLDRQRERREFAWRAAKQIDVAMRGSDPDKHGPAADLFAKLAHEYANL